MADRDGTRAGASPAPSRERRRAPRRHRRRAARRAPRPRRAPSRGARRSSGSKPRARCAARAEEWVQPEPWAARPGWRSPGIGVIAVPSKKTSVGLRGGGRRSRRPRRARGRGRRAPAPRGPSSAPLAGQHARPRRCSAWPPSRAAGSARPARRAASGIEQAAPRLGDHHRVDDDRRSLRQQVERLHDRLDRPRDPSIPIFTASTPMSSATERTCARSSRRRPARPRPRRRCSAR